ncbi:hypothetical protein scyTo_0024756, partial [Scyliorhinus torazame]|nr:hypothetical protein [Scyliorhinus torazame]
TRSWEWESTLVLRSSGSMEPNISSKSQRTLYLQFILRSVIMFFL